MVKNSIKLVEKGKIKEKIKYFKGKAVTVISDFDGTLTKKHSESKKFINSISVFRHTNFLSQSYQRESNKMFTRYYKIETDSNIKRSLKHKSMIFWWKKEFRLLNKNKLTQEIVSKIMDENYIVLKADFDEFLRTIGKNKLIIFSGGIKNIIEHLLREYKNSDIDIIANKINFNEKNFVNELKLIVATNKDEIYLKEHHPEVYEKIKDKPIIIIGDNLNDCEIFHNKKNAIRILLSSEGNKKEIQKYKNKVDFFVKNSDDLKEVIKILNKIIK